MNWNLKLKSYLIILIFLLIGMMAIGIAQLLKTPNWLNSTVVILALFSSINIATAKIFKLQTEIQTFWSLRKIHFLLFGIIAGGIIAISPLLLGILMGATTCDELQLKTTFTLSSVLITLAIVAWEELWFRGIFINYCNRYLSEINISITIGLLFMLVHLLNPEINMLKTGPTLFFAGAFLTIVYFYYRTIWLPIGLHFGNNYGTISSNIDQHWLLGNEGYLGAAILAILFLVFAKLTLNRIKKSA